MNYKTVRLVSIFGSGSCVSSFGSSPKVETAAVFSFGLTQKWKLRTRFQFWAVSTFGPAHWETPSPIPEIFCMLSFDFTLVLWTKFRHMCYMHFNDYIKECLLTIYHENIFLLPFYLIVLY